MFEKIVAQGLLTCFGWSFQLHLKVFIRVCSVVMSRTNKLKLIIVENLQANDRHLNDNLVNTVR